MITDIGLIAKMSQNGSTPPAKLVIGVDITKDVYYKLSDEENVIKGGLFYKGLNLIYIEAYSFFEKSGKRAYFLDLKAGDFILRKEIEIDIQLDLPADGERVYEKTKNKTKNPEYKLSMFIGDELVVSSKKFYYDKISFEFKLPPAQVNYRPFILPDETEPTANSFSIFSALGLAYGLIKKLKAQKSKGKRAAPVQKQKQITVTFVRKNYEGVEKEVKAVITLKTKDIKFPYQHQLFRLVLVL